MSTPDRIAHVKKQLDLLYEQLDQLERTELLTSDPLIRVQIRQQIRESIQPKIDQYKAEELQLQSNNRFPAQSNSRLSEMKTCLHRLYEQLANK